MGAVDCSNDELHLWPSWLRRRSPRNLDVLWFEPLWLSWRLGADPRRAIGLAIPATTTATFAPSDDAHVRDANPTTNYGADPTLQVCLTGGGAGAYCSASRHLDALGLK